MFASDPNFSCASTAPDQTGLVRLDSPEFTVPGSGNMHMAFDHYVATEAGWDGGNLKISVNGGPWLRVEDSDFIYNPYNATLLSPSSGNTNPLASQRAFTGSDEGALAGSWGRSIINLVRFATPGQKVRLRFEFGADFCGGTNSGWYVDDVKVYHCPTPP